MEEELQEEIKKCLDSPAYFFNKYCKVTDKEGNELPKPKLTDEQVRRVLEMKVKWARIETRYPITGEETNRHLNAFLKNISNKKESDN